MNSAESASIESSLKHHGRLLTAVYSLLLLPSIFLLFQALTGNTGISAAIGLAWKASFLLPNLPKIAGVILVDGLQFSLIGLAGFLYWRGYRRLQNEPPAETTGPVRSLFLWGTLFSIVLMLVIPFHSRDIFGYINIGSAQAFYDANPYLTPLAGIPGWQQDTMFHTHWDNTTCPYGFLFAALAKFLCALSNHHFTIAFLLFKLASALSHLASAFLVYKIASLLGLKRPWLSLYLYLWNPLILLQMIANGHNDLLPAALLLAGIYLLLKASNKSWLAVPSLVLSVLVKYFSLLALPLCGLFMIYRKQWKNILTGLLLAGALFGLLGWPYLQDFIAASQSGSGYVQELRGNILWSERSFHRSVYRSLFYLAKALPSLQPWVEPVSNALKTALYGSYILFYAWLAFWFHRRFHNTPSSESRNLIEQNRLLIKGLVIALSVFLFFTSTLYQGWYIGIVFPLFFLLEENEKLRRFGLLMSMIQLAGFTPFENLHIANYLILIGLPFWIVFFKQPRQKLSVTA